jgi:hypothetical protein
MKQFVSCLNCQANRTIRSPIFSIAMLLDITRSIPLHVSFPLLIIMLLMLWRFYMFTVRPRLYPLEPVTLPYWIPCMPFSISLAAAIN